MNEKISLTIREAYPSDMEKGCARLDYESMKSIGAATGDIIELVGKKRTVARVLPLYPADENKNMMRIDGLIRHNAGVALDDTVTIQKITAVPAEMISISPMDSIPPIDTRYIADALESITLSQDDHFMIPYFGGRLTFQVHKVRPDAAAVLVTQNTLFQMKNLCSSIVCEEEKIKKGESGHRFDDRVQGTRIVEGLPKDALILGFTNFVLYETKDAKLDFSFSGGGYWPDEMKSHMDDPLIQALRNFHYEYKKTINSRFGNSHKVKEFDYEF